MKKLKNIIVCSAIAALLVGCGTPYNENNSYRKELDGGYFVEINRFDAHIGGEHGVFLIVYAKDTKVKYLMIESVYNISITPLYNTDGTLQIYEED